MKYKKVQNANNLNKEFIDDPAFLGPMQSLYLGHAVWSERLYVNIDILKPGAKSAKYHFHSEQEEFFLVLEGEGILRLNNSEIPVKGNPFIYA